MAPIIYRVMFENAGWRVECAGVIGPPYNRKSECLADVAWIARELDRTGHEVSVFVDHGRGFMPLDWAQMPAKPLDSTIAARAA